MGRTLQKHNLITIYIRENSKPIVEEFRKLIRHDLSLKKLRYKTESGLLSVAIMTLIYRYVMTKNPTFMVEKKDGTETNKSDDQTTQTVG